MPLAKYKVFKFKYYNKVEPILSLISLFIPLPMQEAEFTPDFSIKGWGFSSMVAVTRWHIPLGIIMIAVSLIF